MMKRARVAPTDVHLRFRDLPIELVYMLCRFTFTVSLTLYKSLLTALVQSADEQYHSNRRFHNELHDLFGAHLDGVQCTLCTSTLWSADLGDGVEIRSLTADAVPPPLASFAHKIFDYKSRRGDLGALTRVELGKWSARAGTSRSSRWHLYNRRFPFAGHIMCGACLVRQLSESDDVVYRYRCWVAQQRGEPTPWRLDAVWIPRIVDRERIEGVEYRVLYRRSEQPLRLTTMIVHIGDASTGFIVLYMSNFVAARVRFADWLCSDAGAKAWRETAQNDFLAALSFIFGDDLARAMEIYHRLIEQKPVPIVRTSFASRLGDVELRHLPALYGAWQRLRASIDILGIRDDHAALMLQIHIKTTSRLPPRPFDSMTDEQRANWLRPYVHPCTSSSGRAHWPVSESLRFK
jgi:hypothetical protein